MTLYKNINSIKMKTVGAVVFIHLLLLIAGVEPNPGPTDKLVFRYVYLLTEVGTELLRKLCDDKVSSYNDFNKELKGLLATNILTYDQKKLLRQLDKNRSTANFDITLLTCLLRNICGLKHPQDPVWETPDDTDFTVEAEITRLRECRNYVSHKGSVNISESEFNKKWFELCQILHRLNKLCRVPNLTEMIMDAKSKPLDDQLKQNLDNLLKAWHEAQNRIEKEIDHLKIGQSEIKGAVCDLKDGLEQALNLNSDSNSYTIDDIKERLRKSYEKHFEKVCVTPLYSEDDRMDMLTVYSRSKMIHVPYHRNRQKKGNYKISSYEQVFSKENTEFRNIFITGDAGMGKTSFCQFMSFLWSKAIAGDIVVNPETKEDARFMTKFDFVFYISLKETSRRDVVSMIVDKYFFTSSKDKYEETIKTIEQLLQTKNCLVILDGLDEWRPDNSGQRNFSLPRKVTSDCDRCTYLTTCRPYILETVRLSEMDIDHQVQITGFDHEKYIREVIGYINESQNSNKDPNDFMRQIIDSEMFDQLHIPLITSQLIVVWFNYEMSQMNQAMVYSSIVDMLFARAIKNGMFPSLTSSDVHLPEPFSRFIDLPKYVCTLEKLCRLSFLLLFDPENETPNFVFTKNQLMLEPYNISSEEIDFLCQLGIISKNKVIGSFGIEKHMLSFLHTSYLEFLAALFVSLFDKTDFFRESVKKICINNVSKYENFLILLSGISSHLTRIFFEIIYMLKKDEWDFHRRKSFFRFERDFLRFERPDIAISQRLYDMQNTILCCYKEICVSDHSQRFIRLEDFNFAIREHLIYARHCKHLKYLNDSNINDHYLSKNLNELLVLNKHNVKSVYTECYLDEFTEIKGLQYLIIEQKLDYIYNVDELRFKRVPIKGNVDVRFNDVMLQNQPTLHGLILSCSTLLSELPVRSLPFLTSINFIRMTIQHDIVHDLMSYISDNFLLENIVLRYVICKEHEKLRYGNNCQFTLNLSDHSKLLLLDLDHTDIECSRINNSCLTFLHLKGRSYRGRCSRLTNVVGTIQNSKLEYLYLSKNCIHHTDMNHVINAISSLKYIKCIQLIDFTLPDSVPLKIHPDIVCDEYISIELQDVTMSNKSFQDFIDCVVKHQSKMRVCIYYFDTSQSNFDSWKKQSSKFKGNSMSENIKTC